MRIGPILKLLQAAASIDSSDPWERPGEFGTLKARLWLAAFDLKRELQHLDIPLEDDREPMAGSADTAGTDRSTVESDQ